MDKKLEKLSSQRNGILLTEVGVWLHLLGKYSQSFVKRNSYPGGLTLPDDYMEIFPDTASLRLLREEWVKETLKNLSELNENDFPLELYYFSKFHSLRRKKKAPSQAGGSIKRPKFLGLLMDAHGRGSGTDKGILKKDAYQQQTAPEVHLSTAFGFEDNPIDLDSLEQKRKDIYDFLGDELNVLKNNLTNPNASFDAKQWQEWRQPFIERLQNDFTTTVGDTRRPINDVSLWDQTASTVAFFKASLAEILLTGSWRDPLNSEKKFKWRILRVGLDGLSFLQNSHRIGDLLARQELIQKALDGVKYLLEVEYPIGQEIYRDESFALYLLPDIKEILGYTNDSGKTLKALIRCAANSALCGEAVLDIKLSDESGRNVFIVGQALKEFLPCLSPEPEILAEWWKNEKADKCRVCQLRPQGYGAEEIDKYTQKADYYRKKAEERNLCCICMDRITGRSKDWCEAGLNGNSIWIDEVADNNAMTALITARFDLGHWLDGTFVSTLLGLPYDKIKSSDPTDGSGWDGLLNEIENASLNDKPHNNPNFPLFNSIVDTKAGKNEWDVSNFITFMVDKEDLNEFKKQHINDRQLLTLSIIRKTPSFARLRRIWETTQNFWKYSVGSKLIDLVGSVGPRIVIDAEKMAESLGDYHAYAVLLGRDVETSFVWDKDNHRLLNIGNLLYLAKRLGIKDADRLSYEEAAQKIKQYIIETEAIKLYEERGSSSKPVHVTTLSVEENDVTIENHDYTPTIPILAEPAMFMALVPADKALDVANHIRMEYEKQFSKVRNRLPLHLDLIFFKRRTPLYAVIDAARRMHERKSDATSTWKVISDAKTVADSPLGDHAVELQLEREPDEAVGAPISKELKTIISHRLGNSSGDVYHPYYFIISNANGSNDFSDRKYHFQAPMLESNTMVDLIHVSELKEKDVIYFMPSTFDFEFLDVTTRRLELQYDERGARVQNSTRPVLLEDISKFEDIWKLIDEHLTATQLKQMIGRIESQREYWGAESIDDDVFRKFTMDVLHNTFEDWEDIDADMKVSIEEWAANGRLIDVIELYTEILKRKPTEKSKQKEVM